MVKYIESDYKDGIILLRASVCNALQSINTGVLDKIQYGFMSKYLVFDCLKNLNWNIGKKQYHPNVIEYKAVSEDNVHISITIDKLTGVVNIVKEEQEEK